MALQREVAVPVWGTASPGETLTVSFRTQNRHDQADAQGRWRVVLDPLVTGGPAVLKIGKHVLGRKRRKKRTPGKGCDLLAGTLSAY